MRTKARFPELAAGEKDGHYESFYLKLVRPGGGKGAWIRHTVHKRPGEEITAALWFVLFDADAAGPRATKRQFGPSALDAPEHSYIQGRRRDPRRGPRDGQRRDRRDGREVGPDLRRLARALPPPAARLPLQRAAPEDQVPEPVPERRLRREARGRRRDGRRRRLARDDRPQLGRRARRALGLGPGRRASRAATPRTTSTWRSAGSRSRACRPRGSATRCWCWTARRTASAGSSASPRPRWTSHRPEPASS